jgi:hypothetical protein
MNKDLIMKFIKVNICIIRNKNKILIKKIKITKKNWWTWEISDEITKLCEKIIWSS